MHAQLYPLEFSVKSEERFSKYGEPRFAPSLCVTVELHKTCRGEFKSTRPIVVLITPPLRPGALFNYVFSRRSLPVPFLCFLTFPPILKARIDDDIQYPICQFVMSPSGGWLFVRDQLLPPLVSLEPLCGSRCHHRKCISISHLDILVLTVCYVYFPFCIRRIYLVPLHTFSSSSPYPII